MKKVIAILSILGLFSSCEKIIDLDLNSTNPKVVIEANINNEVGPYKVRISQTVNYDATAENMLSSAQVIMSDDMGTVDTLVHVGDGEYETQSIMGVIGRTYTLSVSLDGQTYTQSSKMNDLVEIDTAIAELSIDPFTQEPVHLVTSLFTDPATENDFYRTLFFVRGKDSISGFADFKLSDDPESNTPVQLYQRFREELEVNDTIDVELRHIDLQTYDYYATLSELVSAGFAPQGIPENPKSAWTNGALGYFSAYAVDKRQVIISE